jgi:hypothetical protein
MIVMAEGIATGEILDATDVAATDMAATLTQGVIMEDRTTAPTVAAMVAMVTMVAMVAMVAEDRCSVADTEAEDTEAHTVEPMVADTATAMDAMDAAAACTEGMVDEWSAADTEAATDMATEEEGAVDTAMDWPLTAVAAARDQCTLTIGIGTKTKSSGHLMSASSTPRVRSTAIDCECYREIRRDNFIFTCMHTLFDDTP